MGLRNIRSKWLCSVCSTSSRSRCETNRTSDPLRILRISQEADALGARYELYASGMCVFGFRQQRGGSVPIARGVSS